MFVTKESKFMIFKGFKKSDIFCMATHFYVSSYASKLIFFCQGKDKTLPYEVNTLVEPLYRRKRMKQPLERLMIPVKWRKRQSMHSW